MDSWKDELFVRIRHDSRYNGLSVRALAKRHRVGRRIVRQALAAPEPPPRKTPVRTAPVLGDFHSVIDAWLREDLTAPTKQRHTTRRITARLAEEHGSKASYGAVRSYVSRRRAEIEAEREAMAQAAHGFLRRAPQPGLDAEVDFGDVWVMLGNSEDEMQLMRCQLFVFRMCFSGRAVHRVFAACTQEAFLEGHVHALRTLGGVPAGQVRYDNLTPAVEKVVLRSRDRIENPRWEAFHDYYQLTPWYCEPGLRGAHEKGGVEGEVGYFRRNHLVPVPHVTSLNELNTMIEQWEEQELRRRVGARPLTIGEAFEAERPLLNPLPADPYDTRLLMQVAADRYAMIPVRRNAYSVPARLIGQRLRVMLGGLDLVVYHGRTEVARHPRLPGVGGEHLVLDHYLEVLLAKPGALDRSSALDHARRQGVFTREHEHLWERAVRDHGEKDGTRMLVEVLLLHRHLQRADVLAGIRAALALGSTSPDLIALEARKAAAFGGRSPTVTAPDGTDTSTPLPGHGRRRADLPADTRPVPTLTSYDALLRRKDR